LRGSQEVQRFVGVQPLQTLTAALAHQPADRLANTGAQTSSTLATIPAFGKGEANQPFGNAEAGESAAAVLRAERATVRIRIFQGQSFGVGTGTIIDTHGEEALIITCGHVFRDSKGKGRIEVDLFVGGRAVTVPGQLIDFDAKERDIGLVSIRPGVPVVPVPVGPTDQHLSTGQSVFSMGCDLGADPSRRDTRLTAINKFQGPNNVEIAGAPVEGRSGGGLFDQQGRLIGVCNAADRQDDEGLYAGPQVIQWQLTRVQLTHLLKQEKSQGLAATRSDAQIRLAANSEPAKSFPAKTVPFRADPAPTTGDEEVICIVRSRSNPTAEPKVITIPRPSRELLNLITTP
jgi:hypothetical protein